MGEDETEIVNSEVDQQLQVLASERDRLVKDLLGVNFNAEMAKYLGEVEGRDRLYAFLAPDKQDDVRAIEELSPTPVRLIDEDSLRVPAVEHRLQPGERFEMVLDARKIVRPVARDLAGISFHRVAGWTGVPYDRQGRYTLDPGLEVAVGTARTNSTSGGRSTCARTSGTRPPDTTRPTE